MKSSPKRLIPLLLLPALLGAQSLKDFEKKVTEFTLGNGMHFIILERHEAPVVSFHSYVNAGSVDDPSGETGIAHMFEHMAFKGTETIGTTNYPEEKKAMDDVERIYDQYDAERNKGKHADEKKVAALQEQLKAAMEKANTFVVPNAYPRIIEENGGVGMNAGTGEDSTNYFYNFPRNRLELWFLLESQRFYNPVFREFYKERDVVREERRMRTESSPQGKLVEALLATAFEAHPYRNSPAGWSSDIENFRLSEAVQFYKKYYVPANITVGIAGDVSPQECKRLADKYFSLLPAGPLPSGPRTVEPVQHGEKRVEVESPAQPFLAIAYKRPDQNDPDDVVFDVLGEILAGGRTGLLYKDLVRDKQIALGAFAQPTFPGGKYPNLFLFFAVPNEGHTIQENEKACYDVIERLKKDKVDEASLKRVKIKIRADLIRQLDSNSGMASELTSYYVNYGDWRKMFTGIDEIDKVSADDVLRVARKYLIPETRTVAYTVQPAAEQKEASQVRKLLVVSVMLASFVSAQTEVHKAIALPSYKDLKYPPLPPLKIPEPVVFTLPDGMKVYLLEDHELPVISGSALIRTGNLFDPPDKKGLAQVTGDVLRSGGTQAKSGDEIDVQLENIAASVESGISESSGTISFSALRENTDEVLGVFHDLLTTPEFRQDKIDLEKTQLRSSIARRNDDANGIVGREFSDILYGRNNPYGWSIEYADVDHIERQDAINFYKRYYFPANTMLAIYGDFSVPEMKAKLERIFAGWTVTQPPVPKFPDVQKVAVPGVFLATKTDVTQTFFQVGHIGGELRDKDYPALEVASEILGGGFSSRLFQRIRTKLGYAYGISANWGANFDHPGLFEISGSTQSSHTVDTLRAVREELDKMRTSEVSDAELQTAKDTVLNGFVFRFDRPSKTLFRLLTYEYYGYPKDFIFQYQKAIAKVTKEDVLRVAKEYLRPQDLTIVAVGNPKDFKTPIAELGLKVSPIDLTIPQPAKAPAKVDPASAQHGKEMLDKMRTALGGAEKLQSVKDVQFHAEVAILSGGPGMKAKQTNSYVKPATLRQDIELPFGKQSVFFGGESGWVASPQGVQTLPGPVIKQIQGEIFRMLFGLALSDQDPGRTISATDPKTLDISDKQGDSVQLQLDDSGLPAKIMYSGEGGAGGAPSSIEETLSDWRDVNGIKLPFATSIVQSGRKFAEVKVQDYKINSGLTTEELSKKP